MGVTTWAMVEWEADDALGAAAAVADADERVEQVLIVTPDKDLGQCVRGDRVVQYDRRKREIYFDESAVDDEVRCRPGIDPRLPRSGRRHRRRVPRDRRLGSEVGGARCSARYGHLEADPGRVGLVGRARSARGREAVEERCSDNYRAARCCSAGSPPSSSTFRSGPSTIGGGRVRPRRSPRPPKISALPASPSGPPASPIACPADPDLASDPRPAAARPIISLPIYRRLSPPTPSAHWAPKTTTPGVFGAKSTVRCGESRGEAAARAVGGASIEQHSSGRDRQSSPPALTGSWRLW